MHDRHALFTWTAQRDFVPFPLGGGQGAWFWDRAGIRYLDMASVVVNANAGHNHPLILEAMRRQLDELVVAGPSMATQGGEKAGNEPAPVAPAGPHRVLF